MKKLEIKVKKPAEYYRWVAELTDGRILQQEQTSFRKILELNKQGKVKYFSLIPLQDGFKQVVVSLSGGRRLIYFRRTIGSFPEKFPPFLVYLTTSQKC